ncbi:MAG TPA: DUF922 domain-containing protein [Gemmatimonadales bacterium]|nr:DUF922 domain-containing protein [Gemmatimonadales bacterium]
MRTVAKIVWPIALVAGCAGAAGGGPATTRLAPPPPSPSPSPTSSTLDEMLLSDMAPHHGMPWSATRPLRWGDFHGVPRQGGDEAAKTAYGIYYAWKCRGRAFEFRAVAAFHTQESWVQPAVVSDSAEGPRTLGHEQTHFDIAEVYARRLRRHLRELGGGGGEPCAQSDADLSAAAQRLLDEEKAMQRRYDAETAHGLRRREQAAWETEIRRQLQLAGEGE